MGYQFNIVYKSSLENKGVDALSQMHDSLELQSLLHYPTWLGFDEVLKEVHVDVVLQKIITALEKGEQTKPWFSYRRGVLFYEDRLALPSNYVWISKLLLEFITFLKVVILVFIAPIDGLHPICFGLG